MIFCFLIGFSDRRTIFFCLKTVVFKLIKIFIFLNINYIASRPGMIILIVSNWRNARFSFGPKNQLRNKDQYTNENIWFYFLLSEIKRCRPISSSELDYLTSNFILFTATLKFLVILVQFLKLNYFIETFVNTLKNSWMCISFPTSVTRKK